LDGLVPPGPRDAVEGVPPVSFMEGPVPPRALITPTAAASRRTPRAAATPHGAPEVAQRLECASLRALSDHRTAPGDLRPHSCLPQTTRLSEDPTTHTVGGANPTPAPGVGEPEQAASAPEWQGPVCGAACFRQPPSWPVTGRKPRAAPESVDFLPKSASQVSNYRPHSRDLRRSEPRER
jgi:hypothetical protein